ncbi:Ribosomal protein S12 methylthiotransferase RimO [bacterium HR40]|nr:Ribosomal protein S12 methylthiotransferase RimO [bacterium HR40]
MPSTAPRKARHHASRQPPRIGLVSLGCPKALVDSERIVSRLRAEGYELVGSYDEADLVLVNTCGFLDSARAESLDAIGEALAANGRVIVTGCMGVEADLIRDRHPEVLAITGPHQYEQVIAAVHAHLPPAHDPKLDLVPPEGLRLTPRHYAYLKISEGCNHACSFCIIPKLRGPLCSRPAREVLYEAERLVRAGVKELLIISQDTGAYGVDLRHAPSRFRDREVRAHIVDLARALGEFGVWVRLHYVYPYPHVDDLVPLMNEGAILPYLDIPFQHASPTVLRAMRRPARQDRMLERIRRWRDICPEIAIRSTFVVGFPGETERDFELLLEWLEEAELDRVGCFAYEDVAGAAANHLPGHLPEEVKEERRARLMAVQEGISRRRLARRVGQDMAVLIDEVTSDGAFGRTYADAPEIDGRVFVEDGEHLKPGEIVWVEITGSDAHDLVGELAEE